MGTRVTLPGREKAAISDYTKIAAFSHRYTEYVFTHAPH